MSKRENQTVQDFILYGSDFLQEPPPNENYARWVLDYFTQSAICQWAFSEFMRPNKLFCIYDNEVHRVTGASRLGDVWITKNFNQENGYQNRVCVSDCSDWAKEPPAATPTHSDHQGRNT